MFKHRTKILTAIIIDDEGSARDTLKELVQSFCPQVEIIGEADGVQTGIDLINTI